MRVSYAFLANRVSWDADGLFTLDGGGADTIWVTGCPAEVPSMFLVGQIEVAPTECTVAHQVRIALLSPDGQPLGPPYELRLTAEPSAWAPYRPVPCRFAIKFTRVPVQGAGPHSCQMLIDNLVFGDVPFWVRVRAGI